MVSFPRGEVSAVVHSAGAVLAPRPRRAGALPDRVVIPAAFSHLRHRGRRCAGIALGRDHAARKTPRRQTARRPVMSWIRATATVTTRRIQIKPPRV